MSSIGLAPSHPRAGPKRPIPRLGCPLQRAVTLALLAGDARRALAADLAADLRARGLPPDLAALVVPWAVRMAERHLVARLLPF